MGLWLFAGLSSWAAAAPENAVTAASLLDLKGLRGPVEFPHAVHDGVINPDPASPHKATEGVACAGCHHTVKNTTEITEYQACSKCHGPDGNTNNPADRDGFELSNREVSHRTCIGCHRASKAATPALFAKAAYSRCGDCHQPGRSAAPVNETSMAVFDGNQFPVPATESVALPAVADATPVTDRWALIPPRNQAGRWYNPYHQNPLKGDLPRPGTSDFMNISAEDESLANQRQTTGSRDPQNAGTDLFQRANQWAVRETLLLTFDFASRSSAYRPAAWRVSITPAFNFNFFGTQRTGIPFEDVNRGTQREKVFSTVQSAFAEFRLGDTPSIFPFLKGDRGVTGASPYFDSTSVRVGIQPFVSDFRGFIFNDTNLGVRLFGNASSNRYQFNLAGFGMLAKDVDSELNTWKSRGQSVFIANMYRQDTFVPGYTMQFSLHYNHDRGQPYTDENGFVDRTTQSDLDAVYLGWAGEGHFGRLNLTHVLYQALGRDGHNYIANRPVFINAQMAAFEASVTQDWLRFKAGFLYASGDSKPYDGTARGFDSIMDMPEFAGGRFGFWNSQLLRLNRTEDNLVSQNSLFPSLRTNKFAGTANFVNPGLFMYHAGVEADLTTKIRFIANWKYLQFDHTQPISAVTGLGPINRNIGFDNGFGFRFRPLLNDNMIIDAGYAFLVTGEGLHQIYGGTADAGSILHSVFLRIRVVY